MHRQKTDADAAVAADFFWHGNELVRNRGFFESPLCRENMADRGKQRHQEIFLVGEGIAVGFLFVAADVFTHDALLSIFIAFAGEQVFSQPLWPL